MALSYMILFYMLILFALGGMGFAAWKGGRAERFAAGVVAFNLAVGTAVQEFAPQLEALTRFANDGLAAIALLAITVRHGAPWMGGVMLFYAAQFSLHSYYLVMSRSPTDNLHAWVNNINFLGVIWCLVIGTAVAWRKRASIAAAKRATDLRSGAALQ